MGLSITSMHPRGVVPRARVPILLGARLQTLTQTADPLPYKTTVVEHLHGAWDKLPIPTEATTAVAHQHGTPGRKPPIHTLVATVEKLLLGMLVPARLILMLVLLDGLLIRTVERVPMVEVGPAVGVRVTQTQTVGSLLENPPILVVGGEVLLIAAGRVVDGAVLRQVQMTGTKPVSTGFVDFGSDSVASFAHRCYRVLQHRL